MTIGAACLMVSAAAMRATSVTAAEPAWPAEPYRYTVIDQDLSQELKTEDWKTEANVMGALGELGYSAEQLAISSRKLEGKKPAVPTHAPRRIA